MSFLSWAALAVGVLVIAPLIAHLLRRRPPEEEAFAATKLVPSRTAVAQRRTAIEDRALFSIRALAVLLLAALGATPFVKCSRLSLAREGGASVALAIVLDDSMSMQASLDGQLAPAEGQRSRFERARRAALELLEGLLPGDAASIVLAGDPPRVALAATTNLDAARSALERVQPSDRGTDLDGAVKIAGELLGDMQHIDKRVVVLSDLADGGPDAPALAAPGSVKLWIPLDDLRGPRLDCGVVQADKSGARVAVRVVCSPGYAAEAAAAGVATERRVEVRSGEQVLVDTRLRTDDASDLVLTVPESAGDSASSLLTVRLTGDDAIAADDSAPVVSVGGQLHAGVVSDPATSRPPTGGAPMVEQVFTALGLGVQLRPMSTVPDRAEDLAGLTLLVVDDAPGFTPAQRHDLAEWIGKGGVLVLTLGPNAAHAPLGSGFAPMLESLVRWSKDVPPGLDPKTDTFFGESFVNLDELAASGRAQLDLGGDLAVKVLTRWSDGAPFLLEHRLGRGVAYVMTLPFDPETSDLTLRLGFLHLVQRVVDTARTLGGTARTEVGQTWSFDGFESVDVSRFLPGDQLEPLEVVTSPNGRSRRATIGKLGRYEVKLDGNTTTRVAAMAEREVDVRPRIVSSEQEGASLGGVEASVDVSHYVAAGLLALMLAELLLRVLSPRIRARTGVGASSEPPSHDPPSHEPPLAAQEAQEKDAA